LGLGNNVLDGAGLGGGRLRLHEQVFPRDGLFSTLGATSVLSLLFHTAFATFALALRLRVTASTSMIASVICVV
jgi:hypothetical protein